MMISFLYESPTRHHLKVGIKGKPFDAYPSTFEDSLVFENIDHFRDATGGGLVKKFKQAIGDNDDIYGLQEDLIGCSKNRY